MSYARIFLQNQLTSLYNITPFYKQIDQCALVSSNQLINEPLFLITAKPIKFQVILIWSQVQIQAQNPSAVSFLHQRCRIRKTTES